MISGLEVVVVMFGISASVHAASRRWRDPRPYLRDGSEDRFLYRTVLA
jgi:hypothetical protein